MKLRLCNYGNSTKTVLKVMTVYLSEEYER